MTLNVCVLVAVWMEGKNFFEARTWPRLAASCEGIAARHEIDEAVQVSTVRAGV